MGSHLRRSLAQRLHRDSTHQQPHPLAELRSARQDGEVGAVMVLALAFLTVGSLIVASLASWTANDLKNTSNFANVRSLQYSARSSTNIAIQSIRYTPLLGTNQTLNASPPNYCWGAGPTSGLSNINGVSTNVWCSTTWNPASPATRVVTFSACPSSVINPATCAASPTLQAVVTFDDYATGEPTSQAMCSVFCGTIMTVNSWVWSPILPTVTNINPTSQTTSGTTVTITGTGFVSGSTVNFVQESGGSPTSANVVLTATSVTVNSATSISAVTPSMTSGTSYFVTVTTPSGTSAYSSVFNQS